MTDMIIRAPQALVDGRLRPAAIMVAGGRIEAIAPLDLAVRARHETILGPDEVLLPGLVDTHVHVNEPGRTEWEGFASATRAAALGGVTTLLDMPLNSIPPTINPGALEVKQRAARGVVEVDVGFWGGAVPQNLGRLEELWRAGVFGFKCFLSPSGVDEFEQLTTAQLEIAAAEIASFDGLLIVHAEDPRVLERSVPAAGPHYADFLASRPPEAETTAIASVIDAARRTGARVHVLHVSAGEALPLIARAKADGVRITAETCPHYLTLEAEQIGDGATAFKCCPPIRGEANRDRLWQGLLDGTLDLIVSDHSPATAELKLGAGGDFGRAWGGIAGLQIGLPAVWTQAARRGIGLDRVVEWMSANPASFAGLTDRGRLVAGRRADLVSFAPGRRFVVDPAALAHRNPVSAYAGQELTGVVTGTWLAGTPITGERPAGCLLARS